MASLSPNLIFKSKTSMSQFDNVSVVKKSNVYFDGKCVSHTVIVADGTRKTVGVIFPSTLAFNTGAPEIMEVLAANVVLNWQVVILGMSTVRVSLLKWQATLALR
jgi:uncharacterized protein YaiE (UPF0345 family)